MERERGGGVCVDKVCRVMCVCVCEGVVCVWQHKRLRHEAWQLLTQNLLDSGSRASGFRIRKDFYFDDRKRSVVASCMVWDTRCAADVG